MRALVINCTLKPSPQPSNTEALAATVVAALQGHGVGVDVVRAVDLNLKPGVQSDMGEGDDWPDVHERLLEAQILVIASPTWLGRPSSVAQRVLERMDAMLSETDDQERPVAYNRVAGVVVTGNEDGAHHVISEISGGLVDIGYTIPGQAWTYWHLGPGPGPDYLDDDRGHDWSASTGRAMASNLGHHSCPCAEPAARPAVVNPSIRRSTRATRRSRSCSPSCRRCRTSSRTPASP